MKDPFENPEDSRLNLTEAEKSSLNSRNWIQGELIDKYFNILRIKTNDCLLFALDFYNGIKEGKICNIYYDMDIFQNRKILIPILEDSHCFLVVLDLEKNKLEAYDPYDFSSFQELEITKRKQENEKYHKMLMQKLLDAYFAPKFAKSFPGLILEVEISVKTPPSIPVQFHEYDCGIYLLQFAKHIVFGKEPNFEPKHVPGLRDEIRIEIMNNKIQMIHEVKKTRPKNQNTSKGKSMSKMVRRFQNKSMEDCWLNASLQLVLTGLDFIQECSINGSQMWELLIQLKIHEKEVPLDPLPIKQLILEKERDRVLNTGGQLCLAFGKEAIQVDQNIGQQDARDFFVCIREYKEHWMDIFDIFSVEIDSYTECQMCKNKSTQKMSSRQLFLEFDCPENGMNMSELIQRKLLIGEMRMDVIKEALAFFSTK